MEENEFNEEDFETIDQEEMVEFIFDELVSSGMFITREDIEVILDLEMLYMVSKGYAINPEDFEEEE